MLKEHLHCREAASLFDVSHMGQLLITGPDRVKLLEHTTVGSVQRKNFPENRILEVERSSAGKLSNDAPE